jgi:hypothetical protein
MQSNPVAISPQIMTNTQPQLGKTEQLMKDVRTMSIFQQLIPLEAAIGWPIPLRKDGKVYIILPFYGCTAQKQGQTLLFPPFATLTIDWRNLVPVEYVNLRFRNSAPELNWAEQVGTFPHPEIAQATKKEYLEKRHELLAMYDEMFDSLAQNTVLSPAWEQQFREHLHFLIEPALAPYYRVLGSKFFERFLSK